MIDVDGRTIAVSDGTGGCRDLSQEAHERIKVNMRHNGGHGNGPGEVETNVGQTEGRYHTSEEEIA